MEVWKSIEELNGFYEVSNLGRFRSVDRIILQKRGSTYRLAGRIIKLGLSVHGYQCFNPFLNKKSKSYLSHRLVAKYFVENNENKPHVNHKNGIKTDNRAENLEWVTRSENMLHSYSVLKRTITNVTGILNPRSKLNEEQVLDIRYKYSQNMPIYLISKELKIPVSTISNICRRKTWIHI